MVDIDNDLRPKSLPLYNCCWQEQIIPGEDQLVVMGSCPDM